MYIMYIMYRSANSWSDGKEVAVNNTRKQGTANCRGENIGKCSMRTKRKKLYIVYRVIWIYLDRYISYKGNWCA